MLTLASNLTQSFSAFFEESGFFIWPLVICSIVGVATILFKALSLLSARTVPKSLVSRLASSQSADDQTLLSELASGKSSLARLGHSIVENRHHHRNEREKLLEAEAREEIVNFHTGMGALDVVITIAPLLGLLGTASGLVTIFQGLGESTDHIAIARGISEALGTTILGLAIAVPCVIAHSYFNRRIEKLTARMEAALTQLNTSI